MFDEWVCGCVCSLAAHIFDETQSWFSALIIFFGIDFTWLVGSYSGYLFCCFDLQTDRPNILWYCDMMVFAQFVYTVHIQVFQAPHANI